MHPTLHGGSLVTLHTRHHTAQPGVTLIDGSSGLESLRSSLIRLGHLRHQDRVSRRSAYSRDEHDDEHDDDGDDDANGTATETMSVRSTPSLPEAVLMDSSLMSADALFDLGAASIVKWHAVKRRQVTEITPFAHARVGLEASRSASSSTLTSTLGFSGHAHSHPHEPCISSMTVGNHPSRETMEWFCDCSASSRSSSGSSASLTDLDSGAPADSQGRRGCHDSRSDAGPRSLQRSDSGTSIASASSSLSGSSASDDTGDGHPGTLFRGLVMSDMVSLAHLSTFLGTDAKPEYFYAIVSAAQHALWPRFSTDGSFYARQTPSRSGPLGSISALPVNPYTLFKARFCECIQLKQSLERMHRLTCAGRLYLAGLRDVCAWRCGRAAATRQHALAANSRLAGTSTGGNHSASQHPCAGHTDPDPRCAQTAVRQFGRLNRR
ncbi:hypothetical protein BC831DRAFT_281443 [Entophlyctis helioformis]|nr:hypothetical protein BC831DRAFT_281443 [Entophlyctis helioformis]